MISVWPSGWVCHAVRAPGSNVTLPPVARDGSCASKTGSMRTEPVKLQRGSRGFAGEFGHFKVDRDGLECGCGGTGCLETVASGPNIVRRVRERLFSDPSFSVSQLARDMEGTLTAE